MTDEQREVARQVFRRLGASAAHLRRILEAEARRPDERDEGR